MYACTTGFLRGIWSSPSSSTTMASCTSCVCEPSGVTTLACRKGIYVDRRLPAIPCDNTPEDLKPSGLTQAVDLCVARNMSPVPAITRYKGTCELITHRGSFSQGCVLALELGACIYAVGSSCTLCDPSLCMRRLQAWFRPHNPGMTAAEALCAPFFTAVIDPDTNGDNAV